MIYTWILNDKTIQCLTLVILIKNKRLNIVTCGLHYHVMDHFRGIDRLCSRTHSAGDGEEQYISFCFRYFFAGANHQAGFSPVAGVGLTSARLWRAWALPIRPIAPILVVVPLDIHWGWSRASPDWMGVYGARRLNVSLSPACRWNIANFIVDSASSI